MKRVTHWKMTAAAGAVALPLLLSGCSLIGVGPSSQIDAPPANVETQMLSGEIPTTAQVQHDPADLTTVYLSNGQGLLAPVSLPLGSDESDEASDQTSGHAEAADPDSAAKQTSAVDSLAEDSSANSADAGNETASADKDADKSAAASTKASTDKDKTASAAVSNETLIRSLETLVQNGPYQQKLPAGFSGVLPEGTEVKSVTVKSDEKLAVVEFTKAFDKYEKTDERKILEAVTWTLTEQAGVDSVEVWVDGQRLSEMPVDHTPIPYPLTRAVGINLELEGTTVSQTTPVTVYFTATSEAGDSYFVPVTRFVPNSDDPVKAALGQLVNGPQQGDGLEQVLTETAAVKSVAESKDGVVSVSLTDDMFEDGERIPADMLQAVVLTVTENAKGSKVNITFNGNTNVVDTQSKEYTSPVTRPEKINDLSV